MKIRPLVINPEVQLRIAAVKEYAREHPIARPELNRLIEEQRAVGDVYPGGRLIIPFGFRVYFSIEEHPCGWCYHISISVEDEGLWPNPLAVGAILAEYGVKPDLSNHYNEDRHQAVNFIMPIDISEEGLVA